MTYPILPLTPAWENPENQKADVAKTKYGKAGAEQRDFIGINPLSTSWDINVNIRNFPEVDDFLRTRNGQPFRLSLDGGVTDDGKFYTCTEWQIQQPGMGLANFTATFNQIRRLIVVDSITPPVEPPVEPPVDSDNLLGSLDMTLISPQESYQDDDSFNVGDIGFDFPFYGTNYSNINVGTNSYITFGFSSINYSNLNEIDPGKAILIAAGDNAIISEGGIYVKQDIPGQIFRIRFEGWNRQLDEEINIVWECKLYANGDIKVITGLLSPCDEAINIITKGDGEKFTNFSISSNQFKKFTYNANLDNYLLL